MNNSGTRQRIFLLFVLFNEIPNITRMSIVHFKLSNVLTELNLKNIIFLSMI